MNEQMKEIYKQAFDWVQYQLQTVGSDHPVTQKEQLDMVNQKFAELIVRECAGIYSKIDNGNDHLGTDDYLEALHKTFFGVK